MYGRTWTPPVGPRPNPFARPADEERTVTEAIVLKLAHRLFPPVVVSTEDLKRQMEEGARSNEDIDALQRPFRILNLPPELQDWITGHMHHSFLLQEAAIRTPGTPPLCQVSSAARRFYFQNNVFYLSTEPVDQYQKRCRRAMRKLEPRVVDETSALLDLMSHGDVRNIRKIVILRGDYHCMPHTCRYWMSVLHVKDGLLSGVEVEEESELELMANGGLTDRIPVSFMDWSVVPQPADILTKWSKEGHRTLSRTLLRRLMRKMCGWR